MNNLEFQKSSPKKRMGSGAIIFNQKEELLLVKSIYKNRWGYVGGIVDANESPREALIREIREEIGLEITALTFVCVAYYHDSIDKTESLQFKFTCPTLSVEQEQRIVLDSQELME